jgi:hypothetical protein
MKETLEEAKLRQLFKNRSNCYADADDVVQTMDEDCFISTINEWQQERSYSEEEVRQMLFDLGDVLFNNCQNGIEEGEPEKYFDVIIEQFKKK